MGNWKPESWHYTKRCLFVLGGKRCAQKAIRLDQGVQLCSYHFHTMGDLQFIHDAYYHQKILHGLLTPTGHYLDEAELNILMGHSRPSFDGRSTDEHRTT